MSWRERREKATKANEDYEFYEDTHNDKGEYVGSRRSGNFGSSGDMNVSMPQQSTMQQSDNFAMPMGNGSRRIIVYYPRTPEDVTVLIEHLKMNNPVVVNLNDIDRGTAQRILDFLAGAICALSGTTHRIAGNLFLLSPQGVEITIPYAQK